MLKFLLTHWVTDWRTFERLTAEHDALVSESLAGMAKRFGLLDRFMD